MKLWEFKTNISGFALAVGHAYEAGADFELVRRLNRNEPGVISTVGVSQPTLAMLLCWRLVCWPRSTTMIVTPQKSQARDLILRAHALMEEAPEEIRELVWFTKNCEGMMFAHSQHVGVAHCMPGTLGLTLPATESQFTFLIPNLDLIPGCHQRYMPLAVSRPGTTLIANVARRGRLC